MYTCLPYDSIPILVEANMPISATVVLASFVLVALVAIYVPTIYIRKTNKLMKTLEKIEANTRK